MTLLRLSPDSERLRRIAKAHAAGELSTPDYRRIRAEVIERFSSGEVEEFDDDTQPRWLDRSPFRRCHRCRSQPMRRPRRNDASGGGRWSCPSSSLRRSARRRPGAVRFRR